jgi:hypothetical protein
LAERVGMPLKITAKVDPMDQTYFERDIDEGIVEEFIGEISDDAKGEFGAGRARALKSGYASC